MNVQGVRKLYVKPLEADRIPENHSVSVTTGGFSDVSITLEWFKERLYRVATKDTITKAEFAYAINYYEGFSENLFQLFDTNSNGYISYPEFLGGLTRLANTKKKKMLSWFEDTFKRFSSADSLMRTDQFVNALQTDVFIAKLFQLIDSDNSGRIAVAQILDAFGKLTCMDTDAKWLAWFEQQFIKYSDEDRQISLNNFKKAFNMNSFLAERMFQLFDEDNSGALSLAELVNGLSIFLHGDDVEKLHFLFRVYDMDGNGYIEFQELHTVLKACMQESAIKISDYQMEKLTRLLFEDADTDNSGSITFDELQVELEKHPGILQNLTLSASNWIKPPAQYQQHKLWRRPLPSWISWKHFINNWPYVLFILLQIVVNIILFVEAAVKYRNNGVFVSIARGCGQCLNYNPVLVLVLMMRRSLTILRSTPLSHFLPLDHHIDLHKLAAYSILGFSWIHCLSHLGNFTMLDINDELQNVTVWEYLFSVDTPIGWVGGAAGLTGWLLLGILMVICLCASSCVRRKGFFEVFYWTHNLFVLWYIVLILHGPNFWKWFIFPAALYIIERISRMKIVKLARYGRTYIQEGILLPSDVVHLVISRPSNFTYQPGDYIFINVPSIAKYEWHPFTISSAPEQQGTIWLHIRSVGTWTKRLYTIFKKKNENSQKEVIQVRIPKEPVQRHSFNSNAVYPASFDSEDIRHPLEPSISIDYLSTSPLEQSHQEHDLVNMKSKVISVQVKDDDDKGAEIFIDGPYGTPSVHIFQAEHAVLIGAGIGVTPFASILQSVITRYRNAKHVCPKCNNKWIGDIPSSVMRVKKVDFFWINRHQKSFEWFVTLLSQLEAEQSEQDSFERFLELHMYMTSAVGRNDIKAIGLQMALDLMHKKNNKDLITGLRTRTQAGRPDWDKIFQQLDENKKGKVTVFFCGAPALSRILKQKCTKHGFGFRKENF